jgi:hypothetical protein
MAQEAAADEPKWAKWKPAHDALVAWDDARRAREFNEKAILEVMVANMDAKLEVGKSASADLNKYVKELAKSQMEFVKSFGKLGNALDERLHYGSLENAVVVLKMHSINACSIYEEHNKILTETLSAQLTQLIADYSKHSSKILEAAKKSNKGYDQSREATDKAFSAYLVAFEEFLVSEKTGVIPAHDAWMAERAYHQSLETLKSEREKFSLELEDIFEKFMGLEEKRIEATKDVLQLHAAKQKLIFGRLSEGIGSLETATENVNTIADRQLLLKQSFNRRGIAQGHLHRLSSQMQVQRSQLAAQQGKQSAVQTSQQLADLQAQHRELRTELMGGGVWSASKLEEAQAMHAQVGDDAKDSDAYEQLAQQQSPMERAKSLSALDRQKEQNFCFRNSMEIAKPAPSVMDPPKSGYLFRKSKIMKNWKQSHCVLSASGYLYIFSRKEKNSPKYSIPLANISVHQLKDSDEPNVFELAVNQGSFFSSTKYLLQAESQETLDEWTSLLQTYSGSKK